MKTSLSPWVTLLLLGSYSMHVNADTSVWKVSNNNHHLFLGGTVHVLSSSDYPLPAPYEKAYQSSHKLIFETDLQKLKSPEFQQLMLQRLTYKSGRKLSDLLSEKTYQKLLDHCASRDIALAGIDAFKPGLVTTVLLLSEMKRLGLSGIGVDEFFHSKARQDSKPVGQLETIEQQLGFLESMGRGKEDELIEYTLSDIENLSSLMINMKEAWRSGDVPELERLAIAPYIEAFPGILDNMLNNRNNKWMSKIEEMLNTSEVEFILVGALHLVGEQGLLAQLNLRGYTIEQH